MNTLELIQDQLRCPVSLEPLNQAVTLTPCAHKVQEAVAVRSYGQVNNDCLLPNPRARCCLCNRVVTGYMVDHTLRELVKTLFGSPQEELNSALEGMRGELANESRAVERAERVSVPYPGASARFVHKEGNWNLFDSGSDLCRRLEFITSTEGSFLKGFCLLGYRDGSVAIMLTMSNEDNSVKNYFNQFELFPDWCDLRHGFKSESPEQLRIMFNIIATNNEIPPSHFQMIRDIVDAGSHSTEGFVPTLSRGPDFFFLG